MRDEVSVGIPIIREFTPVFGETVAVSDVEQLFYMMNQEADALVFAAALSSSDAYWIGWSDGIINALAYRHSTDLRGAMHGLLAHSVISIRFGSPFIVDTLLKVPASLADAARRLVVATFERFYFPVEEREKRRIQNVMLIEDLRKKKLENIGQIVGLADRIPDEVTRAAIMREIGRRLVGAYGGEGDTVTASQLQLTDGALAAGEDPALQLPPDRGLLP